MDEEEYDYMSDDFLKACVGQDVRPSLIHNRLKQREHEVEKKRKEVNEEYKRKNKSTKVLASERLQEGLEQALGPENKGFAMLQKMGFKPGSSLGATKTGIVEPISINMKNDRKGFGRELAVENLKKRKQLYREKQKEASQNTLDEFRAGLSKKYRERDILSDLHKSEKACHKLDIESGIEMPEETWFWPKQCLPREEEEEEEDDDDDREDSNEEFEPSEKLEMLTLYLRQSYLYCIWCGVKYDDENDITASCPGSTREDH